MIRNTALITGAAAGLGKAFAEALAAKGFDMFLVDRDASGLEETASGLKTRYRIETISMIADLSDIEAMKKVATAIENIDTLEILVNNAGFGIYGPFINGELSQMIAQVQVQVCAPMVLCRAALTNMLKRHSGGIINVCSVGALTRFPNEANYCATKAYLVKLTEILQIELAETGVKVQALCPGRMRTAFCKTAQYSKGDITRIPDFMWSDVAMVVDTSLKAFDRGQLLCVPLVWTRLYAVLFGNRVIIGLLAYYRWIRRRINHYSWLKWLP
jgi:short-subunit dehydrogenase